MVEVKEKRGRSYAKEGIHCRHCHTWIPQGERLAHQSLCTMHNDWAVHGDWQKKDGVMKQRSQCQMLHAKNKKNGYDAPAFFTCDVCGVKGKPLRSNQKRCLSTEKGVQTPCQIEHHRRNNEGDDMQAIKDFQVKYLMPEEVKKRECLRCNKKFKSKGKFNRICPKCAVANERGTIRVTKEVQQTSEFWENYGDENGDEGNVRGIFSSAKDINKRPSSIFEDID